MKYVECWHCECYDYLSEKTANVPESVAGLCTQKDEIVPAHNTVCEEFLLRQGLYTDKEIPEYCKNKNKQRVETLCYSDLLKG